MSTEGCTSTGTSGVIMAVSTKTTTPMPKTFQRLASAQPSQRR